MVILLIMLRNTSILFPVFFCAGICTAQDAQINERAAKEAVFRIVKHSGLQPDFTVRENLSIRTAIAFIKGRERVIEYNPAFIAMVMDSSQTNYSAISILAHEIAHHLLGHTLDPASLRPGDELACDQYSGFVLHAMGATLMETLAAIEVAGDPHGSPHHPPKHARLEAIRQGWEQARSIAERKEPQPFVIQDDLKYVVRFTGDDNTYYVNEQNRLVWFNTYAEPIEFGNLVLMEGADHRYKLTWSDQHYIIDGQNTIWKRTASGMQMNVGRLRSYARE